MTTTMGYGQAVLNQQPNAQVVVPPHKNAVCSDADDTQRDQHIQTIAQQGHIAWQRKTGSFDHLCLYGWSSVR
jgi:hypothetical protein